ncbi:MAG: helix-turn-helix transcriptional regulator [Coriobacteriia bacterium]|nr:helix-turn-helix transcriptional regulator [Coriobacteriia bacterium]
MTLIKTLRKTKGISQEELARNLGVSLQTVRNWESDKAAPRAENIKKLAEFFNTESSIFLT